jgi:bifunctional UDP-N-acetylglucosamine pyrophosphorylase/glucosamine-1-phosphate N-acetyltransferase
MTDYCAVVLAAGKGTRMKSRGCKVLHPVAGRPMILYVLETLRSAGAGRIVVVTGHRAEDVEERLSGFRVEFVRQEPQLGTGHAVAAAGEVLRDFTGPILIACGDTHLIRPETLEGLMAYHSERRSRLTVLTARVGDPTGYGRIVRNDVGEVVAIVEETDATPDVKLLDEINTGMYLVEGPLLFSLLKRIEADNAQGEYYLTDIVREAAGEGIPVHGFVAPDPAEVEGINTRAQLAAANRVVWDGIRRRLMLDGVTLLDPSAVYVDHGVVVGEDTVIHPGVTLMGETVIGRDCLIEPGVLIEDARIGDRVNVLLGSRIESAVIGDDTMIGPMARVRPETRIGNRVKVGNFVEVKKTVIGDGSKASHLTYLGDSEIGRDVNIGCGTITCNYDGKTKHRTIIHDKCFVGSDVQFVAPVEIGEGSLIAAGSTITRDVPPGTLAVARSRQKSYPLRKEQGPEGSHEDREP